MNSNEILFTLVEPFLSAESRTFWPGLLCTVLILGCWQFQKNKQIIRSPSFWLDVQLFCGKQLLGLFFLGSSVGITFYLSTHSILWLDHHICIPTAPKFSHTTLTLLYSLSLFMVWDASRFVLHKMMHEIPLLWNFHQVHHSAERLNPLTHYRIHPVESLLYTIRGILSTALVSTLFYWIFRKQIPEYTLLGVPAIGLLLNTLVGNFRHSELWFPYPHFLEKWLISPAQHQIHHSNSREHFNKNYGTKSLSNFS